MKMDFFDIDIQLSTGGLRVHLLGEMGSTPSKTWTSEEAGREERYRRYREKAARELANELDMKKREKEAKEEKERCRKAWVSSSMHSWSTAPSITLDARKEAMMIICGC